MYFFNRNCMSFIVRQLHLSSALLVHTYRGHCPLHHYNLLALNCLYSHLYFQLFSFNSYFISFTQIYMHMHTFPVAHLVKLCKGHWFDPRDHTY